VKAVNLIPVEERAGQPVGAGRSQGAAYAVLVLIGGLALMAYLYGKADHQIKSQRAQVASLTKQTQEVKRAAEQLAPYTGFIAQREAREQAVQSLIDSRFDWAHVFHEFGRVLPADVSVSSLSGTVGGTSSSAATPSAGGSATPAGAVPSFTLAGCATSQPVVAETLQRLRLIDGVSEVQLQSSGTTGGSTASMGTGGCPEHDPGYNVQLVFDPLPSTSAVASAVTSTVSDASGAPATTPASGTPAVSTGKAVAR
jgi:Tfp pilus assembly protein PilN